MKDSEYLNEHSNDMDDIYENIGEYNAMNSIQNINSIWRYDFGCPMSNIEI